MLLKEELNSSFFIPYIQIVVHPTSCSSTKLSLTS